MKLRRVKKDTVSDHEDFEVLRHLTVQKGEGKTVSAVFLFDRNDNVFYQEEGGLIEPYSEVCSKVDCSKCSKWQYGNIRTCNNVYHSKPLPAHTSKCERIEKRYADKGWDITFYCKPNGCSRPVCNYFEPFGVITDESNVNQYLGTVSQNTAGVASIQGISYEGKQAPFSFVVDTEQWRHLMIVDRVAQITMRLPVCWDVYNKDGIEYRGWKKYCELYGIHDRYVQKEVQYAFTCGYKDCQHQFDGRIFDFNRMWFLT